MRLKRYSNAQIIDLSNTQPLGRGGEARVFLIPPDGMQVAKVYHRPQESHHQKLRAMLANPPADPMEARGHVSIAWPQDLLYTEDRRAIMMGYVMHCIKEMRPIIDFYNPSTRRKICPQFHYQFLLRTARNLTKTVKTIHEKGYVIGDINESNILVARTALITLVDTDSFQVRDPKTGMMFRCPVGKPEYTPPELQNKAFSQIDRAPENDLFGLAVLIFNLLMEGTHPFDGVYQGTGNPPLREDRIAAGHFVYGPRPGPYRIKPSAPPFETLHPSLQRLFQRCFDQGHRDPSARPSAAEWQAALKEAEQGLVSCSVNPNHLFGGHLSSCPWCARTEKLGGRDPFPSPRSVQDGSYNKPPVKKTAPDKRADKRITPKKVPQTPISSNTALVPAAERGRFIRAFSFMNVLAAFLSMVAFFMGAGFANRTLHIGAQDYALLSAVGGVCSGIVVGLLQGVILRKYLSEMGVWVGASVLGAAVGSLIGSSKDLLTLSLCMGVAMVVVQTVALSRDVKKPGWWLAAGLGSAYLAFLFRSVATGDVRADEIPIGNAVLFLLLSGGVQGLAAAIALSRMEKK